jgi:CRP/FNR family transcriptional regulator, cyclic AMP receptor protein
MTSQPLDPSASFETLTSEALGASLLAGLPEQLLSELLGGATRLDALPREIIYRAGDVERCGLIVSGMVRQYLVHADGREITLRYGGRGIIAGAVIVTSGRTDSWAQAVVNTTLLMFDVDLVRVLAHQHAGLSWAIAQEIARTHRELLRSMADTAFGSIRHRTARHILDLAVTATPRMEPDMPLVARVTQQELADAVGSVREVVGRVVRDFRTEGLIDSKRGTIAIRDAVRLGREANFEA